MAKTAEQGKKKGFFRRLIGILAAIGRKFRETYYELKKVTWPTKKDVVNYSAVVLVFMVAMGIVIGVIDLGAGKLIDLLVNL